MRVRLRYLTCKLHLRPHQKGALKKKVTAFDILRAIKESVQSNFGNFGAAPLLLSMQVRYYDEATQIFILRCPRDSFRSVWAAMTLVTSLGGSITSGNSGGRDSSAIKANISVLRVSGSVRTCRLDAVSILVRAANELEGNNRRPDQESLMAASTAFYQAQISSVIQGV